MATNFVDVPTVTTLHGESERTQQAMDLLAAGGSMLNFTIGPPAVPISGITPTGTTMTTAVLIQVTEPLSPEFLTSLNAWLVNRQSLIVAELAKYDVGPPPPPPTAPPVSVTAPVCAQSGNNLTCTNGVWDTIPDMYNYQWKTDAGVIIGGNTSSYAITLADVGVGINCTVTATNSFGATASVSNSVVAVAPPAP